MLKVLKSISLLQNLTKFNEIFPGVLYALKWQATKFMAILNKLKVPKSSFENLERTLCPSFWVFEKSASGSPPASLCCNKQEHTRSWHISFPKKKTFYFRRDWTADNEGQIDWLFSK